MEQLSGKCAIFSATSEWFHDVTFSDGCLIIGPIAFAISKKDIAALTPAKSISPRGQSATNAQTHSGPGSTRSDEAAL